MQILSGKEIKERDEFTIIYQGITSFELMNRAATKLADHIIKFHGGNSQTIYYIFCGNGNNGGDGLLIAKNLLLEGKNVEIYIIDVASKSSPDFISALSILKESYGSHVHLIFDASHFPDLNQESIIIDCLLGSGINRTISGLCAQLVNQLNALDHKKISIDLPSGMHADNPVFENVFCCDEVLTIQDWKQCFFYKEAANYFKKITTIDIGLDTSFDSLSKKYVISATDFAHRFQPRPKFSHKGNFGHGLLIAGSPGMIGASILASKAAIRSGIGKMTVGMMGRIDEIVNIVPEAMSIDIQDFKINLKPYTAVAIGPGIGTSMHMSRIVDIIMIQSIDCQLILDADALNIIAANNWLGSIPKNSILTPHPKEFTGLFGDTKSHFDMVELQQKMSIKYQIYIILKTAHTTISTPNGHLYYNITGNPGMAKAGSGDVLTGLLLGYGAWIDNVTEVCLAAVWNHGKAGDLAKLALGEISMKASDIIEFLDKVHLAYELGH